MRSVTIYEYPAHLRRPLAKAGDELVERGWLMGYEFMKVGQYSRVRFYRQPIPQDIQLPVLNDCDLTIDNDPISELWDQVRAEFPNTEMLTYTTLTGINDGVAVVDAGANAEWLKTRMKRQLLRTIQSFDRSIMDIEFI